MEKTSKPFLKWAGGKTQLLEQMVRCFPPELMSGGIERYVEPFVGGGAVLFFVMQNYQVKEFLISDSNADLIMVYRAVKLQVDNLIESLTSLQDKYLNEDDQKKFYYQIRTEFNFNGNGDPIKRAAQFIFLNRTGFNGLFRVNAKGEFNVSFGSYKNPKICFSENLRAASKLLQKVEIRQGNFTIIKPFIKPHTFVYFDPPYRPTSSTASFTSYNKSGFNDDSQIKLANFFLELDRINIDIKLMLSNSDTKDSFFQSAFEGFNINRVGARRAISCDGDGRGKINELLITNYCH